MTTRQNKVNLILILFSFVALFSCKLKAEQNSLLGQFSTVDILIADNQNKLALKELKKIERKSYDSWSCIGVYKRYLKMGEDLLAENILKKSLKKNQNNKEVLALYSNFLIKKERYDEASSIALKLQNTKYASLYSEALLKLEKSLHPEEKKSYYYSDEKFYQVFMDAYESTKNPVWLKNCAVFYLRHGFFDKASSLLPIAFADADDAYFWAMVLYDAGKFKDAINTSEKSRKLLKDYENRENFYATEVKLVALESDAFLALSDLENAEKERAELIKNIESIKAKDTIDEELLPVIAVNSAIYAQDSGDLDSTANLLFLTVTHWPDYVPGVILYADFAYKSNLEREESDEMRSLRQAGLQTLEMERYDNRRKIPLSDATYRMDQALKNTNDPYLTIARLDLRYKTDSSLTNANKTADLWRMLEDNITKDSKYHVLLVDYALSFLLKTGQIDDAYALFSKYLYNTFVFNQKESFWAQVEELLPLLDEKFAEFAAWFASYYKYDDEAIRLYEYCVYGSGGILERGLLSPYVSTEACMNLADIYFSIGKKEKALDLYGKAAGRESKARLRSEIFYRLACIHVSLGDKKSALRAIDYSSTIYPDNARAQLLKSKLQLQQ
ncbi:MAG: hypothetical protein K5829_04885 [Treponema sp.]|nr:hypothetical protein [Treponema sp.]